jgi:hypothetical protein
VHALCAALGELTGARVPLGWAETQGILGTALWSLGRRETGMTRLGEAVHVSLALF